MPLLPHWGSWSASLQRAKTQFSKSLGATASDHPVFLCNVLREMAFIPKASCLSDFSSILGLLLFPSSELIVNMNFLMLKI